jgi:DNA-binding LacI/PurR family transcriptional regulator
MAGPTITDVARAVGVSPSTVSRALTGGVVKAETKEAILEAAGRLGYQVNRAARALINGRTGNIGLLIPDIANPYFSEVIKGISRVIRSTDYQLVLADSDEDPGRERDLLEALVRQTDGLIVCSPRLADADVGALVRADVTVFLNRLIPGFHCISVDNAGGIHQALRHLHALGHRRIAYVAGPAGSASELDRRAGLELAPELGLAVTRVETAAPTYGAGTLAGDLVLAGGATAVIGFNDVLSAGVLNRLTARGVDVPGQVSVVGHDGIALAAMTKPELTTVAAPTLRIGELAAETVTRLLARRPDLRPEPEHIVLPATLIVRGSTGVAP